MPSKIEGTNVLSWATDLEQNTIDQAAATARLPFVEGHLALMPDAHLGFGSTVGSVIPTRGAIIPSAIGVDIGCGMIAVETSLTSHALPDNLGPLMGEIRKRVPAGMGKRHDDNVNEKALRKHAPTRFPWTVLSENQNAVARSQFASLGGGNHFVEVCLDERDVVWVVLHSGSRGIGNQLASAHIDGAKGLMKDYFINLEEPDLAYLVEDTEAFDAYIGDMLWAQEYAMGNREAMMDAVLEALAEEVGARMQDPSLHPIEVDRINCHHNFTERENHHGKNLWITRKGAIRARVGDRGVIPGSMGTQSYIVSGLGNEASYDSCSHGAGRRMSRGQARRTLDLDTFRASMKGKTWDDRDAASLIDEDPRSYKDIEVVMENQKDLVTIEHRLTQVLNMKGTDDSHRRKRKRG